MTLSPLSLRWFAILVIAIVTSDQVTKLAAVRLLEPRALDPAVEDPVVLIPRILNFRYAENRGAAWSMLQDHPVFLTVLSSVVATVLLIWALRLRKEEENLRWPLGLVLGGAIGNLIDRLLLGHVTDFIDVHWDEVYHFPTFNVGDSAICVGMGLLIWLSLTAPRPDEETARKQGSTGA
jgi:signal peptidase II